MASVRVVALSDLLPGKSLMVPPCFPVTVHGDTVLADLGE